MLTVNTSVAFKPNSRVGKLSLNKSGNLVAYSQKNGAVIMSKSFEHNKEIISLEVITGLEFHQNNLIVSDEGFGLFAFNENGDEIWSCEIPGGVSLFTVCQDFIAVVDNGTSPSIDSNFLSAGTAGKKITAANNVNMLSTDIDSSSASADYTHSSGNKALVQRCVKIAAATSAVIVEEVQVVGG